MYAQVHFEAPDEFAILTFVEAMTRCNERYLRHNAGTPGLYDAGVRYLREGLPELWLDVPNILKRGGDDCEGLSGWRAAELRIAGKDANPILRRFLKRDGGIMYHCLVEISTPSGYVYDDPSARLGMFDPTDDQVAGLPTRRWKRLRASDTGRIARPADGDEDDDRTPHGTETVRLAAFAPGADGRWRSQRPAAPPLRTAVAGVWPTRGYVERIEGDMDPAYLAVVDSPRPALGDEDDDGFVSRDEEGRINVGRIRRPSPGRSS